MNSCIQKACGSFCKILNKEAITLLNGHGGIDEDATEIKWFILNTMKICYGLGRWKEQ